MDPDLKTVRSLYGRLLRLYPRAFRAQFGDSMEQTFLDLCREWDGTDRRGWSAFLLGTFAETCAGIFREHLVLLSPGGRMQTMFRSLGSPALLSLLLILPFMIMEVVNRWQFDEGFPGVLFFAMWLNLFALLLILLPIVLGWRAGRAGRAAPVPARGNTLLAHPRSAALISLALILSVGIIPLLDTLGWLSADRLFNGPNPEVAYRPGMILAVVILMLPIAAGAIAARPIADTLRAGGGLFAHRINVIIVAFLAVTFAIGFGQFIVDQWPCFIGVPNCD